MNRANIHARIALLAAALFAAHAAAEETGSLAEFRAISELPQAGDGPSLYGGAEANPADYPATFWSSHDGKGCTSTLVAPRALLTAAHCVEPTHTAHISRNGRRISGTCTPAPGYPQNRTADWALCLMEEPVDAGTFERINTDSTLVARGRKVRLTGFGCTNADLTGGNDGIFREGETEVVDPPRRDNNDIVTRTGAVLCMGDSGGPAFIGFDGGYRKRVVIAVNSGTAVVNGYLTGTSFLSSLATPDAQNFLVGWSNANNIRLCGVSPGAAQCRPGE
jgi:hypothetical protein